MSTPPADVDPAGRRSHRRTERRAAAAHRPYPYRIDVYGDNVTDVVESVGGWLFDQVMAGWYVNIDVGGAEDVQPLRILGIKPHRPLTVTTPEQRVTVVVAARLLDVDAGMCKTVTAALRGGGDVIVWGTTGEVERRYLLSDICYRPSAAAQAFKAHALRAAGTSFDSVKSVESFRGVQSAPDYGRTPGTGHSSGDADSPRRAATGTHPHA